MRPTNPYFLLFNVLNILFWIDIGIAMKLQNIEEAILKSVVSFSEMWLSSPKKYISLVFPDTRDVSMNGITKLIQNVLKKTTKNVYFLFGFDSSIINSTKYRDNEIVWFSSDIRSYNSNCQNFGFTSDHIMEKKYLLFYVERIESAISFFEDCFIQFNYELVVYYKKNFNDSNLILFEEIYKINPHERKIHRRVLIQFNLNSGKKQSNSHVDFIWKRRNNLYGTIFKGVTEIYPPFINHIELSDLNKKQEVNCDGYLCVILQHLEAHLNFSIMTNLPKQRDSWSFLVEEVEKETYDIGATGFIFNPSRNKRVDFSFGVLPLSYTLAYAKNVDVIRLDLYLQPYRTNSWCILLFYIIAIIVGFTTAATIVKKCSHLSTFKELFNDLKRSINFILRSIVGKRTDPEPKQDYIKVAFVFLVMNGFFLITSYRALLVASLTAHIESPPVKSLKEIVESKYFLGLEKGSATEEIFHYPMPGSPEDFLLKEGKIVSISGGGTKIMKQLVNNEIMGSETILFIEKFTVEHHEYYPCRLFEIKEFNRKGQGSTGMIFRKKWPFKDFLNYHLLVMKETGLMDKLYEPFLLKTKKSCPNQQLIKSIINKPVPVTMNATISLYLIIFIGLVFSAVCLMVELVHSQLKYPK